jgi:hypothetical protein
LRRIDALLRSESSDGAASSGAVARLPTVIGFMTEPPPVVVQSLEESEEARIAKFNEWWYARDPTHVCFFSPETFRWIARWLGWRLVHSHHSVYLFVRNRTPSEMQQT